MEKKDKRRQTRRQLGSFFFCRCANVPSSFAEARPSFRTRHKRGRQDSRAKTKTKKDKNKGKKTKTETKTKKEKDRDKTQHLFRNFFLLPRQDKERERKREDSGPQTRQQTADKHKVQARPHGQM